MNVIIMDTTDIMKEQNRSPKNQNPVKNGQINPTIIADRI